MDSQCQEVLSDQAIQVIVNDVGIWHKSTGKRNSCVAKERMLDHSPDRALEMARIDLR
jgi:hypothetical protein